MWNGKIKEYDFFGNLLFEGEYLKGKKNGKGIKYYDNKKIKFKGEYLDGKIQNGIFYDYDGNEEFRIKNGKVIGKEYFSNGELKFEGEYLNGIKWNGKEYNNESDLIYDREIFNGKRIKNK